MSFQLKKKEFCWRRAGPWCRGENKVDGKHTVHVQALLLVPIPLQRKRKAQHLPGPPYLQLQLLVPGIEELTIVSNPISSHIPPAALEIVTPLEPRRLLHRYLPAHSNHLGGEWCLGHNDLEPGKS